MLSTSLMGNAYVFELFMLFFNGNTCAFLCKRNVFVEITSAFPILLAYLHENTYAFRHLFAISIVNTFPFPRNFQNVLNFVPHILPLPHPGSKMPLFWSHLLPSLSQEGHGTVILHYSTLSHDFFSLPTTLRRKF